MSAEIEAFHAKRRGEGDVGRIAISLNQIDDPFPLWRGTRALRILRVSSRAKTVILLGRGQTDKSLNAASNNAVIV
jgi:hypothetical protein